MTDRLADKRRLVQARFPGVPAEVITYRENPACVLQDGAWDNLVLLLGGLSVKQIAHQLCKSPDTVRYQIMRAAYTNNLPTAPQLIVRFIEAHLGAAYQHSLNEENYRLLQRGQGFVLMTDGCLALLRAAGDPALVCATAAELAKLASVSERTVGYFLTKLRTTLHLVNHHRWVLQAYCLSVAQYERDKRPDLPDARRFFSR